jgi:hypothetical protein
MNYKHWVFVNRKITYNLFSFLQKMPTPVKQILSNVPLFSLASNFSDYHKIAVIELAKYYEKKGELSPGALRHLHAYERALQNEQRAYKALIMDFHKVIKE